jgi:hypothetical protein
LDTEDEHTQQAIKCLANQPWIGLDRRLYKPYSTEEIKTAKTASKEGHPIARLRALQVEYRQAHGTANSAHA